VIVEASPGRYLDIEAEAARCADMVATNEIGADQRVLLRPAPGHRRLRRVDDHGEVHWDDVTQELYDITDRVGAAIFSAGKRTVDLSSGEALVD
jgi:hypothetical protein